MVGRNILGHKYIYLTGHLKAKLAVELIVSNANFLTYKTEIEVK